jgi:copper chaperone NosL
MKRWLALGVLLAAVACGGKSLEPVDVSGSDACAFCRMAVSDRHFAAEVVAAGEEPRFFDDIGCLANGLKEARFPESAAAFVSDHRTGKWVAAHRAVYTKAPRVSTPMGSGIIAHVDASSRDQDPAASGGVALTADEVFARRLPGLGNGR